MDPLNTDEILSIKRKAKERQAEAKRMKKERTDQKVDKVSQKKQKDAYESITIAQLNCNQSTKTINKLLSIRDSQNNFPYDILILSEPPYDKKNNFIHHLESNFKTFYSKNNESKPMTCIVICNKNISIKTISDLNGPCHVKVTIEDGNNTFNIISIYLHSLNRNSFKETLEYLQEEILQSEERTIIAGDFNAHHPRWDSNVSKPDERGTIINETFAEQQWKILNDNEKTFIRKGVNSTIIDLTIVSKDIEHLINDWTVNKHLIISDHLLITFNIDMSNEILKQASYSPPNYKIAKLVSEELSKDATTKQILEKITEIKEKMNIMWSTQQKGKFKNPLISSFKQLIKKLKRQRKNRKSRHTNILSYEIKKAKSFLTKLKKAEEKEKRLTDNSTKKGVVNWKYIPVKKPKSKIFNAIQINDSIIYNNKQILMHIKKELQYKQGSLNENSENPPLAPNNHIEEKQITQDEVDYAIKHIKLGKAKGSDSISAKLLKEIHKRKPSILLNWIRQIYNSTVFPTELKQTRTILAYKGKNKIPNINQLRPIGINSSLSKVFEIITKRRLEHWTKELNVILHCQSGFVKGKSIEDVIQLFIAKLTRKYDKEYYKSIIIQADIKGAFDNISIKSIIEDMIEFNFPHTLTNIIRNYLINRTAKIEYQNETEIIEMKRGTVQGSILSPILFNIAMAKMMKNFIDKSNYILESSPYKLALYPFVYADDVNLLISHNKHVSWGKIKSIYDNIATVLLEELSSSLKSHNLELSIEKSQLMYWPKIAKTTASKEGPSNVKVVEELCILGHTFSNRSYKLLDTHIRNKIPATISTLNSFQRTFHRINLKHISTIINASFLSTLLYGGQFCENSLVSAETIHKVDHALKALMRRLIKANTDVPHCALSALASIPPAAILINALIQKRRYKLHGIRLEDETQLSWDNLKSIPNFHPASFPHPTYLGKFYSQEELSSIPKEELSLFTDATRNKNKGGIAIVDCNTGKNLVFSTHSYSSITDLELMAITLAIINHKYFDPEAKIINVYTDSLANIERLKNEDTDHYLIDIIRKFIAHNTEVSIGIAWIKAHSDIISNNVADLLAKEALNLDENLKLPVSKFYIKNRLNDQLLTETENWYKNTEYTTFKFFCPTWLTASKFIKRLSRETTEVLTSHALYMREYVTKLRERNMLKPEQDPGYKTPFCECSFDKQNSIHLIFKCPFLKKERFSLMNKYQISIEELEKYFTDCLNRNQKFFDFILEMAPLIKPKLDKVRAILTQKGWNEQDQ